MTRIGPDLTAVLETLAESDDPIGVEAREVLALPHRIDDLARYVELLRGELAEAEDFRLEVAAERDRLTIQVATLAADLAEARAACGDHLTRLIVESERLRARLDWAKIDK